MQQIAYTVCATFQNHDLAEQWLAWLRDGHIAEVVSGGAIDAEIIELDGAAPARAFEVRYRFPSRESFELYENEHAPRLRTEGLKLFPVEKGISYRRVIGRVVAHRQIPNLDLTKDPR